MTGEPHSYACHSFRRQKDEDAGKESRKKSDQSCNYKVVKSFVFAVPHSLPATEAVAPCYAVVSFLLRTKCIELLVERKSTRTLKSCIKKNSSKYCRLLSQEWCLLVQKVYNSAFIAQNLN